MSYFDIILIAIGLSMDSFAVAITNGFTIRQLKLRQVFIIAVSLAFFQAVMPVAGWLAGVSLRQYIANADHWIAFGILSFLGVRMIYEGLTSTEKERSGYLNPVRLIAQSVATSIDALVIGVSFAFLKISIATPVVIIGVVTFLFSFAGVYLGKAYGRKYEKGVDIFGGVVLIGIGVKILLEHLLQIG